MRVWLHWAAAIAALLISQDASSQERHPTGPYLSEDEYLTTRWDRTVRISTSETVGLIRAAELVVSDQVDGGCWTNVSAVEARARAELERSGVAVYSEPMAIYNVLSPKITIAVLGYRAGGGLCVGHARLDIEVLSGDDLGSLGYTGQIYKMMSIGELWSRASLFSGASLNDQVMNVVQEWLDTLAADMAAARRSDAVKSFLTTWHTEMPQTRAESDAMLESALKDLGLSK